MAGLIDFFVPPGVQPFLAPGGVPTLPPSPALAGFGGASNSPANLPFGEQSADRPVTGLLADYRRVGLPSPVANASSWPDRPGSSSSDALRRWAEAQVARRIRGDTDAPSSDDRRNALESADTMASPNAYDPFEAAAARVRNAVTPSGGREEGVLTNLPAHLYAWADAEAQKIFEADNRMRLTGEYDPAILDGALWGVTGPVAVGRRVVTTARSAPKRTESRSASLFDPPPQPARPFEADYPAKNWRYGLPADDAGRLTADIEGRSLTAENVAGRRVVGGQDEALPSSQLDPLVEVLTGRKPRAVAPREMGRNAGLLIKDIDRRSGRSDYHLLWDRGLPPRQAERVRSHELGHLIDDLAGRIPQTGLKQELRFVYNDLNNRDLALRRAFKPNVDPATSSILRNYGPEQRGYRGAAIDRELMAEAIRAYMADPNYLKTVAPKTAAAIRAAANPVPRSKNSIQFNTIAGGVIGGALGAGLVPTRDAGE